MIYGGKELAAAFRTVRKNTIQVAEDIPESKYGHVAAPEARSVEQMLSHIGIATRMWIEMANKAPKSLVGFDFLKFVEPIKAEEAKRRTKGELIELLRTDGDKFAAWLE